MDIEVMRENFEEWANDKGFCLDCRFFEEGNNYEEPDTALAFEIWQASRAAIVIELPPREKSQQWMSDYDDGAVSGNNSAIEIMKYRLTSAGLTTK